SQGRHRGRLPRRAPGERRSDRRVTRLRRRDLVAGRLRDVEPGRGARSRPTLSEVAAGKTRKGRRNAVEPETKSNDTERLMNRSAFLKASAGVVLGASALAQTAAKAATAAAAPKPTFGGTIRIGSALITQIDPVVNGSALQTRWIYESLTRADAYYNLST